MKYLAFAIIASLLMAGLLAQCRQRPPSIPTDANWVGAPEGGTWITCRIVRMSLALHCSCQIYDEDGRLWATGRYVLGEIIEDRTVPVGAGESAEDFSALSAFDGKIVYLRSGHLLVPDGCVDYILPYNHGRHVRYMMGKEIESMSY